MEQSMSLHYWLHWKVAMCSISVLGCLGVSAYLLRRYEGPDVHHLTESGVEDDKRRVRSPGVVDDGEDWRPYLQTIHPRWFLAYRLIGFLFFTIFTVIIIKSRGYGSLYYYTEWTFLLVTIYFGLATSLSIYGCNKIVDSHRSNGQDTKTGCWILQLRAADYLSDSCRCIIFPALLLHHYDNDRIDFLSVVMHSMNAVFLLGEATLNSLPFPWFRIAYFCLWTCAYVIFQWIVHALTPMWWPYPFMDLSSKLAPLWYVVVAAVQIPCYLVFGMVINRLKSTETSRRPLPFLQLPSVTVPSSHDLICIPVFE